MFHASTPIDLISGARILSPGYDPAVQYDIYIAGTVIQDIRLHNLDQRPDPGSNVIDARNHLIGPSLCHAHVHLDKCFLFSDPKYSDLELVRGDFAEAMALTSKAKERFEREDLLRRGKWLIAESIAAGMTYMRAFAEVDHVVGFKCLDAAIELKKMFEGACEIQVCAFAQEALFSGGYHDQNRALMTEAMKRECVEVVGSTPYVEDDEDSKQRNITWTVKTASANTKHLDFHLDYDLDSQQQSSLRHVDDCLDNVHWPLETSSRHGSIKTVAIGHCTRLTRFAVNDWQRLAHDLLDRQPVPIYLVGLPTSDLFIQGRPNLDSGGGERMRGTLQIPQIIQEYSFRGCISINNVGNAFTPYGSCDPLSIASMGVGIYHAGTKKDAQILYECVSTRAKEAIGYPSDPFGIGQSADFVLFELGGPGDGLLSQQRPRRSLEEVVYDPPKRRKTVFRGRVITV